MGKPERMKQHQPERPQLRIDPTQPFLNLGCGRRRLPNAVNVDIRAGVGPDVVCDLNKRPWPFRDGQFSAVFAYDIIEHCEDVIATMEEIHRVSSDGALVRITVPHFSCANAFTDPTHKHYLGRGSFDYFTGEHELIFYTLTRFRRIVASIVFAPTLMNKLVHRLANRFPDAYERRWAWIFPAWFVYFELAVVKETK
jgi:hypothetical protein